MTNKNDWQKKQEAIDKGLKRTRAVKAEPNQPLTFILSDKKFFAHASLSSAAAEKNFLQQALGRKLKIYKVWNEKSANIDKDLMFVRKKAETAPIDMEFYQALNRILSGAGY